MAFCSFLWPPRAWDSRRGGTAKLGRFFRIHVFWARPACHLGPSPQACPWRRLACASLVRRAFLQNFRERVWLFPGFCGVCTWEFSFPGFLCCVHVKMLDFQDCCASLHPTMLKFPGFLRSLPKCLIRGFLRCLHLSMPKFPGFLCCQHLKMLKFPGKLCCLHQKCLIFRDSCEFQANEDHSQSGLSLSAINFLTDFVLTI